MSWMNPRCLLEQLSTVVIVIKVEIVEIPWKILIHTLESFYFIVLIYLWLCWVFVAVQAFL